MQKSIRLLFSLIIAAVCVVSAPWVAPAQQTLDELLPVRGLSLAAPNPDDVDDFISFIEDVLVPRKVNVMVLRINYNYAFESYPQLSSNNPLTLAHTRRIAAAAQQGGIRILPQINLLGHQSWHGTIHGLLREFPEFDETPNVVLPDEYVWPNEDGLYTKSYCPLHPEVHDVVFAIVDEILDAFEADGFHAGMDEVFYLGHDQCSRCRGRDPAELFAGEVTKIRNHLAARGAEMWIWGDRLIDGRSTGLGIWEASMNNTHRAVNMIPKDVVITTWHYTTATPMNAYFAAKGFRSVICPWNIPRTGTQQLELTMLMRAYSTAQMRDNMPGVMHTVWSGTRAFMDQYYGVRPHEDSRGRSTVQTFRDLFDAIAELEVQ